ncbi:hypothetical protein BaRGS_00027687, partial [Batillaria attramentaria]
TPVSSIRLVGGRSQYDGVLQVYSGGRWGTVCDDSWTSRESQTACRILFGSGSCQAGSRFLFLETRQQLWRIRNASAALKRRVMQFPLPLRN